MAQVNPYITSTSHKYISARGVFFGIFFAICATNEVCKIKNIIKKLADIKKITILRSRILIINSKNAAPIGKIYSLKITF